MVKNLFAVVYKLDIFLEVIAGIILIFMMLLTFFDVLLRAFWTPIVGSIELICFCGAIVVGFTIPISSWKKSHISSDIVTVKLSKKSGKILSFITKAIGIALFLFIGVAFIIYAYDLFKTGEVSGGLKIPYYPIVLGLAVACFVESLTLTCDIIKIAKGEDNE